MSGNLMNDFLHGHDTNSAVNNLSAVPIAMNSNMCLTPNDLCDLTPFGINKVLFNKELLVVLQMIDINDESPPAREKVTLIMTDGRVKTSRISFFIISRKSHLKKLVINY